MKMNKTLRSMFKKILWIHVFEVNENIAFDTLLRKSTSLGRKENNALEMFVTETIEAILESKPNGATDYLTLMRINAGVNIALTLHKKEIGEMSGVDVLIKDLEGGQS